LAGNRSALNEDAEPPVYRRSNLMKTNCLHAVAATMSLVVLSQCQSTNRSPNLPGYRVIEEKTVTIGTKKFIQRRLLVTERPRETMLESSEVQ
jgi:hypothetical protein